MDKLMKLRFTIFAVIIYSVFLVGCDLITDRDQPAQSTTVGNDLIINEVFSISPDKYYAYSWIEIYNPTNHDINWYNSTNPASGWVAGDGGTVLWTNESGDSWTKYTTDTVPKFNKIAYYNKDTLFAVGNQGKIYKSTDKGQSWFTIYSKPEYGNFQSIWVLNFYSGIPNPKVLWVSGDSGTVLRSINRGTSWTKITSLSLPTKPIITDIFGINTTFLTVCGDTIILRSENIGTHWTKQSTPRQEKYNAIRYTRTIDGAISSTEGRCVGTNGVILYTVSGGGVWLSDTSTVTVDLNSVSCFQTGHAWAVGNNGTIVKTTTKGTAPWTRLNSGTNVNLNYVEFVDQEHGFVLGDGGLILYTSNGGTTWTRQESGTTAKLTSASFLPLLEEVLNLYVIQAWCERQHVFADRSTFPPIINRDFITKVDTGFVYFQSQNNVTLEPGGFVVITSDENKFENHTYTGPSDPIMMHNDIAAVFSSNNLDSINNEARNQSFTFARWNLLRTSEIRLLKIFVKFSSSEPMGSGIEARTLEVIRFGDYQLSTDYSFNLPAPAMPEWWSLARYKNLLKTDLNTFSTNQYYYLTNTPIPGWVSQLASP
ncbi:MAG: hypothetical protein HYZ34_03470 [Ignavibacteriae bacterium]|nr:hypothetical protein [Ignavibacteriota bacterium]